MKLTIKILVGVVITVIILVFSLFHIFIMIKGRTLLEDKLKSAFGREVTLAKITTRLPFDLVVKNLDVKGLFTIEEVYARGGMFDVLSGNFVLPELRIKKAVINIERLPQPQVQENNQIPVTTPAVAQENKNTPPIASSNVETFKYPNIIIKSLLISESTFNLKDCAVAEECAKLVVKDVNIKIENLELPIKASDVTHFELTGSVPWRDGQEAGKIWLLGWVNFLKKDMRAELKINAIDAVSLAPYYSGWVNLDKSHIQKAKLNFLSEINSLNNEVSADCHLELARLEFAPRAEDEPPAKAERIATAVIDMFKAIDAGKIVLDFKYKTKMDSPELGLRKVIQLAVKDKITQARKSGLSTSEQVIQMPFKLVEGTISGATGLTKSVINGTMSVGREFKNALESSFTKEKPAAPAQVVNQTSQDANLTNSSSQ